MRITSIRFVALLSAYAGWSASFALGQDRRPLEQTWTVDGVARSGLVYLPDESSNAARPVVFAFHGHGGGSRQAARSLALHTAWPEAVTIYLQGLPTPGITDPQGLRSGWQRRGGDQADRDLKLFDAALQTALTEWKGDADRVYATGHSNGGLFTFVLWAERGDALAAVAPSAAVGALNRLKLKPKPALHVAGEADQIVSYAMQQRSMEFVRELNGCEEAGRVWKQAGPLTATEYLSPRGTPFVTVVGPGDHKYPSEASQLIADFFQQHRRSPESESAPSR